VAAEEDAVGKRFFISLLFFATKSMIRNGQVDRLSLL